MRQEQKDRLAAILLAYCKANNLSGNQLGRLIGVSQTSAQAYLDARTYPSEETRKTIAKVLGVTYQELQAEIDGVKIQAERSADEVVQDIRTLPRSEFYAKIAPAVFEIILSDHQSRVK